MAIPLPARSEDLRAQDALAPRAIVAELDRYVVGQAAAKRAVAIALRNRTRRQRLPPEVAAEITPKNILMIGPTGVGKTEIARRLAKLSMSPFVKVEASKFTEVGYVGRDVDSIVRDLVEAAVDMVRREKLAEVRERAGAQAEERMLDLLLPPRHPSPAPEGPEAAEAARDSFQATREKLREKLRAGALDARMVEVEVPERSFPSFQILSSQGVEEMDVNLKDMLPGLFGGRTRRRNLPVPEAREVLRQEEEARLVDQDQVARLAVERAQSSGIVFLDEIDKIAGREGSHGPDVSREGVQRDILPIVEGTTVSTKYGAVRTDHVLFIADPGRAAAARGRGSPADRHRAEERAQRAVPGAPLHRGDRALLHRGGDPRDGALRHAGQRGHREHRRPPPRHRPGDGPRPGFLRGRPPRSAESHGRRRRGAAQARAPGPEPGPLALHPLT